jgi:hypothetical protein
MFEDEKTPEKKFPKDISKMLTDTLIKEFIEMDAALNTKIDREAIKQLRLKPRSEQREQESKEARIAETETMLNDLKNSLANTPDEYRKQLETKYRQIEEISNNAESFKAEVDNRKTFHINDLIQFVATKSAELDTQIERQAYNELGKPIDEDTLKLAEKKKIKDFVAEKKKEHEQIIKDVDKDEADLQISINLQKDFGALRAKAPGTEVFNILVEQRKSELQEAPHKPVGKEEPISETIKDTAVLSAQKQADTTIPNLDILWNKPVSDVLSLSSLPRKNIRGAA